MTLDLLTEIYSSFEPFQPPPKEAYVDCQEVRGGWEVVRELGRKIARSKKPTCQLYSGHRGVGKSTELLRLKEYLEQQKYCVVYFAADDEDIEPQDAEYADILFACTRHLVEAIKLQNHNPLLDWMKEGWESLKDIALTEISFEGLNLEGQISQFAKITANLRATPDKRRELRQKINANTPSLVDALNDFIKEAQKSLAKDCRGIVMIADNLDRIVEIKEEGKPSNYDEIYLNRSEILRGLACHVIYTVPIAMVYSGRATQLEDNYDKPDVLPMVMVRNPDGSENKAGLAKLRELVCRRVVLIEPNLARTLEGAVDRLNVPPVFDSPDTLKQLCLMSGGHVRNLMQLIQKAIDWTDELPIAAKAARRAIEETRETYQKTVQEHQWEILARACYLKQADNNEEHLRLLLNRCLLEYRYYDDNESLNIWCNVHPLIEGIPKFQDALAKVRSV
ncbi:MAG TPA: pilus assembly protein PilB [Cyanobacteria bacterium UBA11372]|nr:pilus assembly protein PilB [Cyanobacteria bacterium UBA11372]